MNFTMDLNLPVLSTICAILDGEITLLARLASTIVNEVRWEPKFT